MYDPRPRPPRGRLKQLGLQILPFLPFIVLAAAVVVAIYHIQAYW